MASFKWAKGVTGAWDSAANWLTTAVPNDPAADVVIDAAPVGTAGFYNVIIAAGVNETVKSLDLATTNIGLEVDGTLTFAPGSLGALGREFQSSPLLMNNGTIVNAGMMFTFIQTRGNALFTGANPIYIAWELQVLNGTATVDTASIAQYSAAQRTLFDGVFEALGAGQTVNLGGKLGGFVVNVETLTGPKPTPTQTYWTQLIYDDPGSHINEWNGSSYVSVESTLKLIQNAAYVTVTNGRGYATANALTIGKDGVFEEAGGTLSTGGLTILAGGLLVSRASSTGAAPSASQMDVNGAVTNNGLIVAEGSGILFHDAVTGTGEITFNRLGALPGVGTPVDAVIGGTLEVGSVGAGQTIAMIRGDTLILDRPAAFAGVITGFAAGDKIIVDSATGMTGATYAAGGNGFGTLTLNNGTATLGTLTLAGDFTGKSIQMTAGPAANSYSLSVVAIPPVVTNFMMTDTTTGVSSSSAGTVYNGPVAGLQSQFIYLGVDNLNIASVTPNCFIRGGPGTDAIDVSRGGGINVLDGSTGSNFLVGGAGNDTFFVDDRIATSDIWSTVVNFHSGDAATIFGVTASAFAFDWEDNQGAVGATGLTLHATAPGKPIASITLAGYSRADLGSGRLTVSFSDASAGANSYMYIHGT